MARLPTARGRWSGVGHGARGSPPFRPFQGSPTWGRRSSRTSGSNSSRASPKPGHSRRSVPRPPPMVLCCHPRRLFVLWQCAYVLSVIDLLFDHSTTPHAALAPWSFLPISTAYVQQRQQSGQQGGQKAALAALSTLLKGPKGGSRNAGGRAGAGQKQAAALKLVTQMLKKGSTPAPKARPAAAKPRVAARGAGRAPAARAPAARGAGRTATAGRGRGKGGRMCLLIFGRRRWNTGAAEGWGWGLAGSFYGRLAAQARSSRLRVHSCQGVRGGCGPGPSPTALRFIPVSVAVAPP